VVRNLADATIAVETDASRKDFCAGTISDEELICKFCPWRVGDQLDTGM